MIGYSILTPKFLDWLNRDRPIQTSYILGNRKTTVDIFVANTSKSVQNRTPCEKKNSSTVVLQLLIEHVSKTVEEFFFSLLFFLESFFVLTY